MATAYPIASPSPVKINFYSDTVTLPSREMRAFMADAEVGDEQKGEDPSVNRLLDRVTELLGKERAVFLPSGTMCNEIAFAVHCRPGDEILLEATSHPVNFEGGGVAALAGAMVRAIEGERGMFTAEQLEAGIRTESRYAPRSRMVSVEQTTNMAGGFCWPKEQLEAVAATAHEHGLAAHLDGARLFNAVVATGTPAHVYSAPFDSVWIDLTKGLGAPVGAVLAGSQAFIDEAWRLKQRWGGAMRQAGIIAAAGLFTLDHNIDRLAEDHANANALRHLLLGCVGIQPQAVETNLVFFEVCHPRLDAPGLAARMLEGHGIRIGAFGKTTIRMATHLNVSREDVYTAVDAIKAVLASA